MPTLITGALGFIGSHFAKVIDSYNNVILDAKTYAASIDRVPEIKSKIYIGDINDFELVTNIVNMYGIDTIVNFAAETHVDNSIISSTSFINSNYLGVHNILEVLRRNQHIRFVQISTDEVYGSAQDCQSFDERDPLHPNNPYSATKAAADLLCISYANTYKLDIVITRSSNNYGPYQHEEKFIPKMLSLAKKNKPLQIYGDGSNIRDWIYVTDNTDAIKLVMEKGESDNIYNISACDEKTNNEIAEIISTKFNVPIDYIKDRPGHDFRYSILSNKIRHELGWKPKVSFEEGISELIKYYHM